MSKRTLHRSLALLLLGTVLAFCPSLTTATQVETGGGTLPGYIDFSYDSNSVLFNTTGKYDETVFLDTIYPFDQTLRYKHSEPLVRYDLEHKTFKKQNVLMVALADLQKIYAPYFTYEVIGHDIKVSYRFYHKLVTAGATTRTPTIRYTKMEWEAVFSLKSLAGLVKQTTYQSYESRSTGKTLSDALDNAQVNVSSGPSAVQLVVTPSVYNHLVYMPVASFMQALGKTPIEETSQNHKGYVAISTLDPKDLSNDLFNPKYDQSQGGFPYTPITEHRVAYMDGVLNGTITKGNFWSGFFLGDEVTVFTGAYPSETTTVQTVNRILPYRLYIPHGYDPDVPSKFTFELHGSTGNENAQLERANDHLTRQPNPIADVITVEDYADFYNYILLSPNGWTRGPVWGSGPAEVSLLMAFEHVKAQYNIDLSKVFVTGNSAGGGGTINFAARHTAMFKAMAPTAPAGVAAATLTGPILDLPTHYLCNAQDVTVPYAGTCIPDYRNGVGKYLHNVTIQTIEEGHHSYGFASAEQVIFEFFDGVLAGLKDNDVASVQFTVGSNIAVVTDSHNTKSDVTLATAPALKSGKVMVGLADLATVYGPTFKAYDVYAYNTDPSKVAAVIGVKFNNVMVNIKNVKTTIAIPKDTFVRIGGAIHVGDTDGASTTVQPGDSRINLPTDLSVAPSVSGTDVLVPVVEFMGFFGKAVTTN